MIVYDADTQTLSLFTLHTCYQMKVDSDGRLLHTWYGSRPTNIDDCPDFCEYRVPNEDPGYWPDLLPLEYATPGVGDNRIPALVPEYDDGTQAADLRYIGHKILNQKYTLPNMPTFRPSENAQSLCVTLQDIAGLKVELWYAVYSDCDLITRTTIVTNMSKTSLMLRQVASLCLDFPFRPLDYITLDGIWAGEHMPTRTPLRSGVQSVGSTKGIPGHRHNPAAILCTPNANELYGECWATAFVYSGNFEISVEHCEAGARLICGINSYHFAWKLKPGESFVAPEAALVYSDMGLGEMSRRFHRAIRAHLLPPNWVNTARQRPVLINSWEAFYFDFDEKRLLELACAAHRAGIDLFVLDDGWFIGRHKDTTSLGDWQADITKLPEGLPGLCRRLNEMGMNFGIWIEPEAISLESNLYREHPDWVLRIPGRDGFEIRYQYTLDFSRQEVIDGIWEQLNAMLSSCPIHYLKWDMNRGLATVYSAALSAEHQGEVYHRYVLGVYELQRRLTEAYPDLLLENCAGGGARFDCGMLYYSPQIWCSDNTDACARAVIQYGTSMIYPYETIGAHFSTVPNHCTGHISSLEARMALALSGTFGFELDLTKYSSEKLETLRSHIEWFHAHEALLHSGELYRLVQPDAAGLGTAWCIVASDGSELVVFCVGTALAGYGERCPRLILQGLDESAIYESEDGRCYSGFFLQSLGLPLPGAFGQTPGGRWYLRQVGLEKGCEKKSVKNGKMAKKL